MEDLEGLQYLVQNINCAVKSFVISVNTEAKIPQTKFYKKAHIADITN